MALLVVALALVMEALGVRACLQAKNEVPWRFVLTRGASTSALPSGHWAGPKPRSSFR